jgi:hypothetical protein
VPAGGSGLLDIDTVAKHSQRRFGRTASTEPKAQQVDLTIEPGCYLFVVPADLYARFSSRRDLTGVAGRSINCDRLIAVDHLSEAIVVDLGFELRLRQVAPGRGNNREKSRCK